MTAELRFYTQINSHYQVFDASGHLPFSIVFGLCRRSLDDTDPRPLLLDIPGSVLNVPYALTHGLLTLHEKVPEDGSEQWVEIDLSQLKQVAPREAECLSLSSPVDRTEHWRDAFTIYQCPVDAHGELASILGPGKRYRISLASADLGVKRWAYSNQTHFIDDDDDDDNDAKPSQAPEVPNLVISKRSASHAAFKVVESLPQPPKVQTSMRLYASSPSSAASILPNASLSSSLALEVSVLNLGSDAVTVQTRGHQRFLVPWGPFQPESDVDDRMRIIDAMPHKPLTSSLQIVDAATGDVVRDNKQRGTHPLTSSTTDGRPKVESVVTLRPGEPLVRKIDLGALMGELTDGQYRVRMQTRGCRWWQGEIGEDESEDGRVSAHLCRIIVPPLMLESRDEVELCIRGGEVRSNVEGTSLSL